MANTENTARKSWNFGHFGTRHDGTVWTLVRIKDTDGQATTGEVEVASNKSATPLVKLAREMTKVEKRSIKIAKLEALLDATFAELDALRTERDTALNITPEEAKAVLEALDSGTIRGDEVVATPLTGKALKARAKELGIKGRGSMSASDLRAAVAAA